MAKTEAPAPVQEEVVIPTKSPSKCFRLMVRDSAPIDQVTIGGHTFVKQSNPVAGFDRGGKAIRKSVEGVIEQLTQKDHEKIVASMKRIYLRSTKIPKTNIVSRVEAFEPSELNPMDPSTDENVAQFVVLEEVPRPLWWDEIITK